MHEPVDPGVPANGQAADAFPCPCACGETGEADAGQSNSAMVQLIVHIDMNGDPEPDAD